MPRASRSNEPSARKALGQHFLRDGGVLRDIAGAVRVPPGGLVLEIGPGPGALTAELLAAGHEVVALELDPRMVEHLQRRFAGEPRLRVVEGDARDVDFDRLIPGGRPYSAAGNLPYFAANPIIRRLLEAPRPPVEAVVMVQREVAREISAPPGQLSLLGVSVQVYAEATILFNVPPEAFDPPPKVVSSVVRLVLRDQPLVPAALNGAFFDLVSKTFRNPRKQIHNSLARGVWLPAGGAEDALARAGIDGMRRPETVTIPEWLKLLEATSVVLADA
jgi:16S rRNA (adenine1518-N6/adenine1519-N6)-dimethyltransferase